MSSELLHDPLAYAALVALLAPIGLWRLRAARLRKWLAILASPSSEVALLVKKRKRPRWTRDLPEGLNLDSKRPLSEALHRHFRASPKFFLPRALGLAFGEIDAIEESEAPRAPEPARLSDEEKINSLLSARPDPAAGVPTDALAQNLVLNLINVLKGKKKLTVGLEHALWDSFGAGGGFAGAKLGGAVGMSVAPFLFGLSAVFIPFGVLLGGWLGALAGKSVGTRFKSRRYFSALRKLRRESVRFRKWFLGQFPGFLERLDGEYRDADALVRGLLVARRNRFSRLVFPDLLTTFFRADLDRLRRDHLEERERFAVLRKKVKGMDPVDFASILRALDAESAESDPDLREHRRACLAAWQEVRDAESFILGAAASRDGPPDPA